MKKILKETLFKPITDLPVAFNFPFSIDTEQLKFSHFGECSNETVSSLKRV